MTTTDQKLTLAEAQWVVDEHNRYSPDIHVCDYEWPICNAVRFARALLAYDKALRQVADLAKHYAERTANQGLNSDRFRHVEAKVRAVLLAKGEDDAE